MRLVRAHPGLALVVGLGALLRLAAAIAYRPALLFNDSWTYLDLALRASPVGFAPERPSGYPLLLRALLLPGRSLALITTVQHVAGLVTGVLAYALLLRLGVRRGWAVGVAALILLDSYAVVLEQHVLTETFFGLALLGSAFAAIAGRGARALAVSGALLAVAVTLRTNGIFVIPVWGVYLLWSRRGWRSTVAALATLGAVLFAYAALHARGDPTRTTNPHTLSLTELDGWFLYARTAAIADCSVADVPRRARALCQPASERSRDTQFYLFNPRSPAKRLSRRPHYTGAQQAVDNALLRDFAFAVIRSRPWAYTKLVGGEVLDLFTPGGRGIDVTVQFPRPGPALPGGGHAPRPCSACDAEHTEPVAAPDRSHWFPGFRPRVHAPAAALVAYGRLFHTPRLLMGILALLALASTVLALTPLRHRLALRRETFLLGCGALSVLVGSAATANTLVRFLVPVVPLLACGGACALMDLVALRAATRAGAR